MGRQSRNIANSPIRAELAILGIEVPMVSISRDWWEHLAPKVMHRRRSEVEALLRQWCRSDYGAHWLRFAKEERGAIRASNRLHSSEKSTIAFRSSAVRSLNPGALANNHCMLMSGSYQACTAAISKGRLPRPNKGDPARPSAPQG
jgi:hypothetical protein